MGFFIPQHCENTDTYTKSLSSFEGHASELPVGCPLVGKLVMGKKPRSEYDLHITIVYGFTDQTTKGDVGFPSYRWNQPRDINLQILRTHSSQTAIWEIFVTRSATDISRIKRVKLLKHWEILWQSLKWLAWECVCVWGRGCIHCFH